MSASYTPPFLLMLALGGCPSPPPPDDSGETDTDSDPPDDTSLPDETDAEVCEGIDTEAGTGPVHFFVRLPSDDCLVPVVEHLSEAYWSDWFCQDHGNDSAHAFSDASGRCVFFNFSRDWAAFNDPWLRPCADVEGCCDDVPYCVR